MRRLCRPTSELYLYSQASLAPSGSVLPVRTGAPSTHFEDPRTPLLATPPHAHQPASTTAPRAGPVPRLWPASRRLCPLSTPPGTATPEVLLSPDAPGLAAGTRRGGTLAAGAGRNDLALERMGVGATTSRSVKRQPVAALPSLRGKAFPLPFARLRDTPFE